MKYKLLKAMYDKFCAPLELKELRKNESSLYESLREKLSEEERIMLLQLVDAKNLIAELTNIDCFITGFELAWSINRELRCYEEESPESF